MHLVLCSPHLPHCQHDDLMHGLHSWFEATADEMAYTVGTSDGPVPSEMDTRAFSSKREFDVRPPNMASGVCMGSVARVGPICTE